MFGLLNDLRSGLRTLRRDPGYAGMIVITLAICIGADTAVFSVVDSVLLQPLPVPDSDRIVLMANHYPNSGAGENLMSSGGDYIDRLSGVTAACRRPRSRGAAGCPRKPSPSSCARWARKTCC